MYWSPHSIFANPKAHHFGSWCLWFSSSMHLHQFPVSIIGDRELSENEKMHLKNSRMIWLDSDFPHLHLSSRYFGRQIFNGLHPIHWGPDSIILEPLNNHTSEHNFLTHWKPFFELNKPNSDGFSLIKPHLCGNKEIFLTYKSIV